MNFLHQRPWSVVPFDVDFVINNRRSLLSVLRYFSKKTFLKKDAYKKKTISVDVIKHSEVKATTTTIKGLSI